jgi:hypothetical protein
VSALSFARTGEGVPVRAADRASVRRLILLAVLVALVVPSVAPAAVRLGVSGSKSRFRDQTGQRSKVNLRFISWGQREDVLYNQFVKYGPIPMISFGTRTGTGDEAMSPRAIAKGRGDGFLLKLNRAAFQFGREAYVRPLAEMNGHWNYYCAYNANGSYRGDAYSRANFRRAFRRIYLIMHGGALADLNARLASSKMRALRTSHDVPRPDVRVVWNPQGFGSPNLAKNSANSYYPGDRYVDVVANDLYDQRYKAEWEANLDLYRSHPSKAYGIGEWGLWGIDDPAFVRKMAAFVDNHPRTKFIVYYKSERGSVFDLGSKPSSRAAYRRYITPLGG